MICGYKGSRMLRIIKGSSNKNIKQIQCIHRTTFFYKTIEILKIDDEIKCFYRYRPGNLPGYLLNWNDIPNYNI